MELKLKIMDGAQAGRELKITKNKFMVGRADDCHLKPHSDQISRYHCCILNEDGFITVRDLGSKNGTFVNDERISGEVELNNGDVLVVGPLKFQVNLVVEVKGEKKPKVNSIAEAAARTAETAAPAVAQDDFDVAQWLGSNALGNVDADTAIIDMKTTTVNLPPKYVPPAVETPADETGSGTGSDSKVMDKAAGTKLPPKALPKDSREGAANAISKIMRGR